MRRADGVRAGRAVGPVTHVNVAVSRRRRRIAIESTRLPYRTDHLEKRVALLPDGNRPANRAATFARQTDAIKQLKQNSRALAPIFQGKEL